MSTAKILKDGRSRRTEVDVVGRARLRYLRAPAQKTRLVVDMIRGRRVEEAFALLRHSRKSVAADILKLLRSAVANTENAPDASLIDPEALWITHADVGEGPVLKRIRPAPMGRAFPVLKRQCHVTIEVGAPSSAAADRSAAPASGGSSASKRARQG